MLLRDATQHTPRLVWRQHTHGYSPLPPGWMRHGPNISGLSLFGLIGITKKSSELKFIARLSLGGRGPKGRRGQGGVARRVRVCVCGVAAVTSQAAAAAHAGPLAPRTPLTVMWNNIFESYFAPYSGKSIRVESKSDQFIS